MESSVALEQTRLMKATALLNSRASERLVQSAHYLPIDQHRQKFIDDLNAVIRDLADVPQSVGLLPFAAGEHREKAAIMVGHEGLGADPFQRAEVSVRHGAVDGFYDVRRASVAEQKSELRVVGRSAGRQDRVMPLLNHLESQGREHSLTAQWRRLKGLPKKGRRLLVIGNQFRAEPAKQEFAVVQSDPFLSSSEQAPAKDFISQ